MRPSPPRPSLPAAADVTAEVPAASRLERLLAEDRRAAELSHPWFDSEPAEEALSDLPMTSSRTALICAATSVLGTLELLVLGLVLT